MDKFSKETRSMIMSRIRSKDTKPEIAVRKFLYANGFRYVLHRKALPGKPDLSNESKKVAVFVNGCFWHHHGKCKRAKWPKTNQEYWIPKIKKNSRKDSSNKAKLEKMGWSVHIIWECETSEPQALKELLNKIKKAKLAK